MKRGQRGYVRGLESGRSRYPELAIYGDGPPISLNCPNLYLSLTDVCQMLMPVCAPPLHSTPAFPLLNGIHHRGFQSRQPLYMPATSDMMYPCVLPRLCLSERVFYWWKVGLFFCVCPHRGNASFRSCEPTDGALSEFPRTGGQAS